MANHETVTLVPSKPFTSYPPVYHEQSFPEELMINASVEAPVHPTVVECTHDVSLEERLRVRRFRDLVDRWSFETIHISSLSGIEEHEALQEIIGMGTSAVPLILSELRERPSWLLLALDVLVDNPPALGAGSQGGLLDSTKAWIEWGTRRGYFASTTGHGYFASTTGHGYLASTTRHDNFSLTP